MSTIKVPTGVRGSWIEKLKFQCSVMVSYDCGKG